MLISKYPLLHNIQSLFQCTERYSSFEDILLIACMIIFEHCMLICFFCRNPQAFKYRVKKKLYRYYYNDYYYNYVTKTVYAKYPRDEKHVSAELEEPVI